jgi:hypothetical protein
MSLPFRNLSALAALILGMSACSSGTEETSVWDKEDDSALQIAAEQLRREQLGGQVEKPAPIKDDWEADLQRVLDAQRAYEARNPPGRTVEEIEDDMLRDRIRELESTVKELERKDNARTFGP